MTAFDKPGITKGVIKSLVGVLFIMGLWFCQIASAMTESEPIFELTYFIFGQSDFVIKVYVDGKVHYQGNKVKIRDVWRQRVAVLGDRYAQLTREQVEELRLAFLSLPFKELLKYEKIMRALPTADIVKYKDNYVNMRINNRIFFLAIATRLNKLINIDQWICFPKGDPEHDFCLIHDLPDDFEY
ncbi:hypothetical protein [Methylocaldum szegediense]|jgi:hypothetical protein|uniref:Chalcone isomerase domain-containing protein n=1 Tax=Methylocaldum szegediense TaxID=73780 RepID=A0ABN8X3G7_9GAMM|nr:hypothetical protein [Methylocaldum szegediense]CAI8803036.1 conserved protein of unknown function [Methylocaldum szegediense]